MILQIMNLICCKSLSLSYIYIISYFFIKIKYDTLAAGLRLELSFPVLETSALANVLTRNIYIQDTNTYDVLPVELLPYMAGEDGTRTHNLRLGKQIHCCMCLYLMYILYQKFFIKSSTAIPSQRSADRVAAQIHSTTLLLVLMPEVSSKS